MSAIKSRILAIFSYALILVGIASLAMAGTQIYQGRQSTGNQVLPVLQPVVSGASGKFVFYPERPKIGDVIGELRIPSLKKSVLVIEGTGSKELKRGAGHYVGSVLPGESDNSVIAGHRDSYFSELGKLAIGDILIIQTRGGKFTYQVNNFRIVGADDKTVIVPTRTATLTLSTCYPFRYIGNAPKRFIVSAHLIDTDITVRSF